MPEGNYKQIQRSETFAEKNPIMKIAFLAPGSSIHTVNWINQVALHGNELHLITMHNPNQFDDIDKSISIHALPVPAPAGYYVNQWLLRQLLQKLKPDLLHAHYASGYGTLARLSRFHPMLLSVWGEDVFDFPYQGRWKKRILEKNLAAADYIGSTSHIMKQQTKKFCRVPRDIQVTPFGVDCNVFRPYKTSSDGEIVIGTIKTLGKKYGVEYLIKAFAFLVKRHGHLNLKLVIAGDGPLKASLMDLARNLGVYHLTNFVGKIPHRAVPEYLNTFTIFAALSVADSESFGVAVVEASACGVPVVVSNVGGLPEVVQDGITGIIVPPRDPEAAAQAMEKIILNPKLKTVMGERGRKFVMEHYEINICYKIMHNYYSNILYNNKIREV